MTGQIWAGGCKAQTVDLLQDLVAEANPCGRSEHATPAMTNDSLLPLLFPAVAGKNVTAAFDGGGSAPMAGVTLLAQAERRLGIADRRALGVEEAPTIRWRCGGL